MISEGRPWVVFVSAVSLVLIWIFGFGVHNEAFTLIYGQSPSQQKESAFIAKAMAVEFPAPMDYTPMREVCARSSFRPGLLFTCDGQHGGIGMVRNQILKCVRYAMHAGAAVVIPTMAKRSADDLAEILTFTELPLDYLMDRHTFVSQLSAGCPEMRIYERAEDFPFYENRRGEPLSVVGSQWEPDHQPTPEHPHEGLKYTGAWRYLFDQWLDQQGEQPQVKAPIHVLLGQSYLEYPVRDDGRAFSHEFGKVLSFSNETRALAAKVLFALKQRLVPRIDPAKFVNPNAYYGAHLRLEEDALWAWPPEKWRFSRMKDQFEQHFQYLERTGLRTVYVASGNQTVTDMFAEGLSQRLAANPTLSDKGNVTVVTKHDLLEGADRKKLDDMTFDQQALVDFMMLSKASAFMGVAHSSYSWNIALRRHELSKYAAFGNNGSDLLRDELSIIMGMEADYPYVDPFVNALWP
ncbi:unnamed protein product [Discula destructiva]